MSRSAWPSITAEEWLQREDAAKRKRAVEEAKAKPYAENYRYLVALQEGYVMVASKSEALILQELVALECRWNTSRRSRSRGGRTKETSG
ncbi:MAG: hypothetical protein ACLR23_03815 [Clostridia bacterium]